MSQMIESAKPDTADLREQMKLLKDKCEALLKRTEALAERIKSLPTTPPKLVLDNITSTESFPKSIIQKIEPTE